MNSLAEKNKLEDDHKEKIFRRAQKILDTHLTMAKLFDKKRDLSELVRRAKTCFRRDSDLDALVGSVFAVWSAASMTDRSSELRMPLPAQVLAIIRLLGMDKELGLLERGQAMFGMGAAAAAVKAHHLAQVKTGQGKSVILGTLATVLAVSGLG